MPVTTLTPARDAGLRHHLTLAMRSVSIFSIGLFAAHGGWAGTRAAVKGI